MLHIRRPDGAVLTIHNLNDQVYSMEHTDGTQYHWSVAQAREKAQARGEIVTVSLSELGVTPERVVRHYDGLDTEYALTTDLREPLLFVPFGEKHQLIDGHHRLFKAAVLGVDLLPAYILTEEEADSCLVCKLPPGKGIDWGQERS